MYPLTLELVDFLLSDPAQSTLILLSGMEVMNPDNRLHLLTDLRKKFSPQEAAVLLDQALLRRKAETKFPMASKMLFTEEALQQATALEVAAYHSELFANLGTGSIIGDFGCGIGGDTLAFARHHQVVAVERDEIRCALAEANITACHLAHRVVVRYGDWTHMKVNLENAYIDPSRRIQSMDGMKKRVFHLDQMEPPLSAILKLQQSVKSVAVKVAPGIRHDEIPLNAEVSFVSLRGQMKEALIRFGNLRTGALRTAVLLPDNLTIDTNYPPAIPNIREPGRYLCEPDAAVIRAGLVRQLAASIGYSQMHTDIAYLTGDHWINTKFGRFWQIMRHGPFLLKRLNLWLRELDVGSVIIKKRGSPIDIDVFRHKLKLNKKGSTYTIILTRVGERPWMLVCKEANDPKTDNPKVLEGV